MEMIHIMPHYAHTVLTCMSLLEEAVWIQHAEKRETPQIKAQAELTVQGELQKLSSRFGVTDLETLPRCHGDEAFIFC